MVLVEVLGIPQLILLTHLTTKVKVFMNQGTVLIPTQVIIVITLPTQQPLLVRQIHTMTAYLLANVIMDMLSVVEVACLVIVCVMPN